MSELGHGLATTKRAPARTLFYSSAPLGLFEQFRVPYELDPSLARHGIGQLRAANGGPSLLWSTTLERPAAVVAIHRPDDGTRISAFARLLPEGDVQQVLGLRGGSWDRVCELAGANGERVGSIWRREDGTVFIPFDPNEVVTNYLTERYLTFGAVGPTRRLRGAVMRAYYRARPLLPRPLQIWLRRQFAPVQARSAFPAWPIETGLHDFFDLMFGILEGIAGEAIPYIAPWPHGRAWALVLTHDVERAEGLRTLDRVLALERRHGVRSSWNLVAADYPVDPACVAGLLEAGLEVGVHGLHHDGRDLESLATWKRRLAGIAKARERWGASGFRSASLHRRSEWMQMIGFDYDSSYPDTDPFEPQNGGCCTWWPFFNGKVVELPLTLPQDHTLFVILRHTDEKAWVEKATFLRAHGGMALLDTHPDYLVDERILSAYARFLDRFASDATAWKALPREVSAWWRRRAASDLERDGESWRIVGPAADQGRVELAGGRS